MRIVFPMLIMLIAGLSLGSGMSTLYWSGALNRSHNQTKQVFQIADTWKELTEKNLAGWNECNAVLARVNGH